MNTPELSDLLQHNIHVGLQTALPFLLGLLLVGILVGLFQAATQVNEPSISFLAKLLTFFALITFMGTWALNQLQSNLIQNIQAVSHYKASPSSSSNSSAPRPAQSPPLPMKKP